jgi:hypothetical protein
MSIKDEDKKNIKLRQRRQPNGYYFVCETKQAFISLICSYILYDADIRVSRSPSGDHRYMIEVLSYHSFKDESDLRCCFAQATDDIIYAEDW